MRFLPLLLLTVACATGRRASVPAAPAPTSFAVESLAPGVYALIRREPSGFFFESNAAFIIGARDVIVIDAQFSATSARETLAALRNLTSKPVRAVVNTHSHLDHVTGNQVYTDAFPGALFIAHEVTRANMAGDTVAGRAQFVSSLPRTLGFFRDRLTKGLSLDDSPLADDERAAFASDSTLGARHLADAPGFRLTLPELTFRDRLTLYQDGRAIELRWLGRAHTAGDIVIHLPAERIVFSGDLVVWPVPLVGTTSFPTDYATTLDSLRALGATTIVPGHGPVMHDDAYVRLMQRMLRSVVEQTRAAAARGETLEQARRSVNLAELRAAFAGGSKMRGNIFDQYVAGPAVARAFEEATKR